MKLDDAKDRIPSRLYNTLLPEIDEFRPAQEKAIGNGLLERKNLLVCTPTASGKTLIAELAMVKGILEEKGKAIYIVPSKALAGEKFNDFKKRYKFLNVAMSIGDLDSADPFLESYDIIVCTAEKLDSLIRHHAPWLSKVGTIVVDEVHLMNDSGRGPTLEVIMTMLMQMLADVQIVALSATIGNPKELAEWLQANLIEDDWRPVKLEKGIMFENKIEFEEENK
ncbi:DEAD/DEAH box helicase [Candidatus Woesearchaeota archaeon]|nr:DEAD/DEAH box helicase [Candidatus Woesearchaeota archaeon]